MEMFYVLEYNENSVVNYFLVNEKGLRINGFNGENIESLIEQATENGICKNQITCLATRDILARTRINYGELIDPDNIKFVGERD